MMVMGIHTVQWPEERSVPEPDSRRIFILSPRSTLAYGQDFLDYYIRTAPGFVSLPKQKGVYPVHLIADAKMVVGQNPDDAEESRALNRLAGTFDTAVFVHCQWQYYSEEQQRNVAHALDGAVIGLTPARFLTERMQEKFPSVRWKTLDGCVDTTFFSPSTAFERSRFRRRNGLPEHAKVVLFAGRLESAKGIRILKDLCAAPGREFAIVVQYPAWPEVQEKKALFGSYLNFCGSLSAFPGVIALPDENPRSNPKTDPRPIRFADISLSTSLSEVQPLVLLEALASGVPFVGTNSTPDYDQLRARFSDCAALADAIEIIDLPEGLRQGAVLRPTDIGAADSMSIANRLAEAINRKTVPDDSSRAALSEEFLARGFTVPARIRKFRQALEDALVEEALS